MSDRWADHVPDDPGNDTDPEDDSDPHLELVPHDTDPHDDSDPHLKPVPDGPDPRDRRLLEAANRYRYAAAEADEAEEEHEVAQDALTEAECDCHDASNRLRRTHLGKAWPVGFQPPLSKEPTGPFSDVDMEHEDARLCCSELSAIVDRAYLRNQRAQRNLCEARNRLLEVAAGE